MPHQQEDLEALRATAQRLRAERQIEPALEIEAVIEAATNRSDSGDN